jgi:hypothetical protein
MASEHQWLTPISISAILTAQEQIFYAFQEYTIMDYDPKVAEALAQVMREVPEAKPGKMFGMPAYKVKGKLAVGMFESFVVIKLGADRAKALIGKTDIGTFEPQPGRVWKDWVSITGDLKKHRALLEEAVQFVADHPE